MSQKNYQEAFKWVVNLLDKHKIKFNVIAGLAAHVYGAKRSFNDIDLSMNLKDMKKLEKLSKMYITEKPHNSMSSNKIWTGYLMKLKYKRIMIEITESEKTKIFNKKTKKWEKFPAGLKNSVNKKIFGISVPIMPKQNLIDYKSKLNFPKDKLDLKYLK